MRGAIRLASVVELMSVGFNQPVSAVDIGKALQRPVTTTLHSSKGIFDLERCIVLLDGPGGPTVLRQPDRPDDETIAYVGNAMMVVNVISMHRADGITTIEIREMHNFVGVKKSPSEIDSCL